MYEKQENDIASKILIVEDEPNTREAFFSYLKLLGYEMDTATNGKEAVEKFKNNSFHLILMDLKMPVMDGFEAIKRIREMKSIPYVPIIAVSGLDKPGEIRRALESGADDYVSKNFEEEELLTRVKNMILYKLVRQTAESEKEKARRLEEENISLKKCISSKELEFPEAFSEMISGNSRMLSIFKYLESIAKNPGTILITGETGTGKELAARAIHTISGRTGKFVPVNLAGLDDSMFSDSLFGHVKGAFTGAQTTRNGLIERACGGTLFLDEIGELEPASQIKLLRFLQDAEYYPIGSDSSKRSCARMIFATNKDLQRLKKEEKFREDFYYRIKCQIVHLPPLRERMDDIPILTDYLLEKAAKYHAKKAPTVPPELYTLLSFYHWPGNVRELEAIISSAVGSNRGKVLSLAMISQMIKKDRDEVHIKERNGVAGLSLMEAMKEMTEKISRLPTLIEVETVLITLAMECAKGNQKMAAPMIGMTRPTLCRKLMEMNKKEECDEGRTMIDD